MKKTVSFILLAAIMMSFCTCIFAQGTIPAEDALMEGTNIGGMGVEPLDDGVPSDANVGEMGVEGVEDQEYVPADAESVAVPADTTVIGEMAFRNCKTMKSVTIPASVTEIGDGAFANCAALTDVYFEGTEDQWNAISIGISNEALTSATLHFGSEEAITATATAAADGVAVSYKSSVTGKVLVAIYDKTSGQMVSVTAQTLAEGTGSFTAKTSLTAYNAKVMFVDDNQVPLRDYLTVTK